MMTKKIYFLLAFLLTTIGGGNSAWADSNTFVWNFAKPISTIDQKLLNGTKTEWNLVDNYWKHTGGTEADNSAFAQNGIELEHVYGLRAKIPSGDTNTLIYPNSGGLRLNTGGDNRYLCIPSLKAGDKVTVLCNNYSSGRGITLPDNIVNSTATGWGSYSSTGEFTCEGYVEADGNVLLKPTSALDIKTITVESSNKPWPTTLRFEKCEASATVNVKIPYGASTATYTNALVAPEGCGAVSYDVLLGNATVDANGVVTINAAGEVIVRATTAGGDNYSAYYCDYIINATETEFTEYSSSANTYEWRFYDVNWWVTESSQLDTSNNKWWYLNDGYYKYKQNDGDLSNASLVTTSPTLLPETNNLTFTATKGRVGIKIGSELFLGPDAQITLPSLIAGARVTVRANAHTSNKTLTVANGSESSFNLTTATQDFTFTVSSAGQVSLTNNSNDYMRIYAIVVEKPEFTFSEYQTTYWDGTTTTETKTVPYKADGDHKFSVGANVPSGASLTWEDFTISSSNTSVVSATLSSTNFIHDTENNKVWFSDLVTGNAGTAVLTFTFNGNSSYGSKSFTVSVTVTKATPTLAFNVSDKGADVRTFTAASANSFTKGITVSTGVTGLVYSSSDTHVATINSSTGEISVSNSGSTTIKVKYAGNANYNAAETFCYLVINGSSTTTETLSWNEDPDSEHTGADEGANKKVVEKAYGTNEFSFTAKSSGSSTVKYKSSDSDIATVKPSGAVTLLRPGEVWINAYIEGDGDTNGKELKYYLKISGGEISINFSPSSGTVSPNCIIMPRLVFPTMEKSNITYLTIESNNTTVATVPSNNLLTQSESLSMQGTRIDAVNPIINGIANGTATITVKFKSPYYNDGNELTATYELRVNGDQSSTGWLQSKREYTITTGEYMMMPSVTGNFNGNINGLSKGSVCEARHGYVYSIMGSSRTITWNNANYYYGEGVPDYTLTPAAVGGGEAYIYWCTGEDSNHPSLMIYGESAGDMILRATDSQTGYSPDPITIHIVDKADNVTDVNDAFWADKKFPFTWDFTNIAPADIVDDDVHWRKYGFDGSDPYGIVSTVGQHFLGMPASFNYDYSDEDYNGVGYEQGHYQMLKKYITNGEGDNCKIMPAFYGIRLDLGNNASGSYWSKRDKVMLYDTDSSDPRLYIEGGEHRLYLPAMPASKRPSATYRIYIKTRGHNANSTIALLYSGENDDNFVWSGHKLNCPTVAGGSTIYFDIPADNAGKKVGLAFENNVDVYWIAFSTEARTLMRPDNTTYAAASYSYNADLDLSKSAEVNEGVKAYYASNYAFDKKAEATDTDGYAVVMTEINKPVPTNTGLILKKNTTDASTPCYMIANGQNVESYVAPSDLAPNYLKPTSPSGKAVGSNETIGSTSTTYTNFAMAYAYKMYHDPMNPGSVYTDYLFDRDWSFYKIMGDVSISNKKSYLQIPGNLYVDRDGKIVEGAASRRAADDNRPSTKPMLDIIFEDEPSGDHNVTGITSVSDRIIDNDAWYTLQGIRVDAPAKGGIYIHNGRKVVIK